MKFVIEVEVSVITFGDGKHMPFRKQKIGLAREVSGNFSSRYFGGGCY